jgi:Rrf2 family protein
MRLTQASTYALAYLVYLARERPDRPVPSYEAAREEGLPERFLLKVLGLLARAGVLWGTRGPSGGYRLAREPKDITLLEVIEAVDGPLRGDAGAVGKKGAALDHRLQAVCDQAAALVRERLKKVTLADLARGR